MAKKLQFKPIHGRLVHPTLGEITNQNLTEDIYNKLVAEAEGHKDLFEEVEVSTENESTKSKPNKNDVQA